MAPSSIRLVLDNISQLMAPLLFLCFFLFSFVAAAAAGAASVSDSKKARFYFCLIYIYIKFIDICKFRSEADGR